MKKIAAIILLPLIIINCCNDNKDIPDYRDKYIGDYQCNRTGGYFCGDIVSYYNDTTLIIAITPNKDSLINILDATLKINANGEFNSGLSPNSKYHGFGGYIINDSIFFNTYQGGLGCFVSFSYKGKKM